MAILRRSKNRRPLMVASVTDPEATLRASLERLEQLEGARAIDIKRMASM